MRVLTRNNTSFNTRFPPYRGYNARKRSAGDRCGRRSLGAASAALAVRGDAHTPQVAEIAAAPLPAVVRRDLGEQAVRRATHGIGTAGTPRVDVAQAAHERRDAHGNGRRQIRFPAPRWRRMRFAHERRNAAQRPPSRELGATQPGLPPPPTLPIYETPPGAVVFGRRNIAQIGRASCRERV